MNKSDVVKGLTRTTSLPYQQVDLVIDEFLDLVTLSLACGEDVLLSGFGKFEVRDRRAVTRVNPRTRQKVEVPEKRAMGFKPSIQLKERLNRTGKALRVAKVDEPDETYIDEYREEVG